MCAVRAHIEPKTLMAELFRPETFDRLTDMSLGANTQLGAVVLPRGLQ